MSVPRTIVTKIGNYFLAGLIFILPIVLTVLILQWVAGFLGGLIGPGTFLGRGLETLGFAVTSQSGAAYLLGWAVALGAVFLLGIVVDVAGRNLVSGLVSRIVGRIPIVGSVYSAASNVASMLDQSEKANIKSMQVVFCYFGKQSRPGVLALMPTSEIYRISGRSYNIVLVPTSPVPIGGGLLFIPTEDVEVTDIPVDSLINIYASMGASTSQYIDQLKQIK